MIPLNAESGGFGLADDDPGDGKDDTVKDRGRGSLLVEEPLDSVERKSTANRKTGAILLLAGVSFILLAFLLAFSNFRPIPAICTICNWALLLPGIVLTGLGIMLLRVAA